MIFDCETSFEDKRRRMVLTQVQSRGVTNEAVLGALLKIPRHLFVPENIKDFAYQDNALPIEKNQTISQPYIVGLMTELARLKPDSKVLEIGTGSGYQTAVLAEIAKHVFSIEILPELSESARIRLETLKYSNICFKCANGYLGWSDESPFDSIIVTAASKTVPEELIKQLKTDGLMVIPLGDTCQYLYVLTKQQDGSFSRKEIIPVRFVPMTNNPD